MKLLARILFALLLLFLPVLLLNPGSDALAARPAAGTLLPARKQTVVSTLTWYDWWMVRWENNEVICRILVEHPGLPYSGEILNACGSLLHSEWKNTQPCNLADPSTCRGMYLHQVRTFPGKRSQEITLPAPKVWLSLVNCESSGSGYHCSSVPALLLSGEEPLVNEIIIRIQGTIDGEAFSCPGNLCTLPLRPTSAQGVLVEFWADSSLGDATERYKAMVRVVAEGEAPNPEPGVVEVSSSEPLWLVDILSSQFREGGLATCSDTWQVFPDPGGPPVWLSTPLNQEDMLSTQSYYYLAGNLITEGLVSAGGCPNGGLAGTRLANQCGLEAAKPTVLEWQNRFDTEILKVAQNTGVPAQLIKNVFGRESQFWPGLYSNINEAGLGQLTDKGSDMLLMWNTDFFKQYCPNVLSEEACSKGFIFLKPEEQDMLRGSLVSKVNASCPDCPLRVDLEQARFSVQVFAQSMLASCSQTARMIYNVTNRSPGLVSTYVDLWKFSLVNYNAGPGCFYDAAKRAWNGSRLLWERFSISLDPACSPAVEYVNSIAGGNKIEPTPTSWVYGGAPLPSPAYPTAGPRLSATPTGLFTFTPSRTPTRTIQPFMTSTPTPTTGGYPAPGTATRTTTSQPTSYP